VNLTVKDFENRSTFAEVTTKNLIYHFFLNAVYMAQGNESMIPCSMRCNTTVFCLMAAVY